VTTIVRSTVRPRHRSVRCALLLACGFCSIRRLCVSALGSMEPVGSSVNFSVKLNDGNHMPRLGLGVFKAEPGQSTYSAVLCALKSGYRQIDTAGTSGDASPLHIMPSSAAHAPSPSRYRAASYTLQA